MKVLHINTNDTGGAAIAAARLHYLLLEKGIDSKLLFLKRSGSLEIKEAYYFEDIYSSTFYFKSLFFLNSIYNRRFTFYKPEVYFNGPDSLFNIAQHPLFQWADIIHLHWVVKFLDWKKVFKHSAKKFIWTFHDMNPFSGGEHYQTGYNAEFSLISKRNIRKKINLVQTIDLSIITPSDWLGNLVKKTLIFEGKPIITIRNPVSAEIFHIYHTAVFRDKFKLPDDKMIILCVAENPSDKRKGIDLLLNSLERIKNKDQYHLLIIGNTEHLPDIKVNCTLPGTILDERMMADIYNSADLFIIPSIEDNLPNTVSESLLCGTPVVGFRTGGIAEMVKDGINGYLATEFGTLESTIETSLSHVFDRDKIRKSAFIELDSEKLYAEFMTVYNSKSLHH